MEMGTVVTFGELMLRLTTPGHLRFAQAPHFEITFGGAEANVAVAIAQLGGQAEFVTRLPENPVAQRALDELRGCGVGTRHTLRGGERMGVYYLEQGASQRAGKVIYDRAASAFAEAAADAFQWSEVFAGAQWFHWSGITPALSANAAEAVRTACTEARRRGLTISFDMNYRAKLWGKEEAAQVLRPLMEHVDFCCTGVEEAREILGAEGGTDEEIARDLVRRFGFKVVAMTQRQSDSADSTRWSAMLLHAGAVVRSATHEITIVDRLGAGDSFTGALIFSWMRGDAPQRAIDFAVAASALNHTIAGDYNRVSLAEVEALAAGTTGGRVQR